MEKLKKLKLRDVEKMTEEEMKFIIGGSGSGGSGGCAPTKIDACRGLKEGSSCCFMWNGRKYYGGCRGYAVNYTMHCSDLN